MATATVTDPETAGVNPIMEIPAERKLPSRDNMIRVKLLGFRDTMTSGKVIKEIMATGSREGLFHMGTLGSFLGNWQGVFSVELVNQLFVSGRSLFTELAPFLGLVECQDEFFKWLSSILELQGEDKQWGPVSQATVEDPTYFPMEFLPDVLDLLLSNSQIRAFFAKLPGLSQNETLRAARQATQTPIDIGKSPSTPFSTDTPGSPTSGFSGQTGDPPSVTPDSAS